MEGRDFPNCVSCPEGNLLPLSDFGQPRCPNPLQGMGVQQPGLRLQHKDPQRRRVPKRTHRQRGHALPTVQIGLLGIESSRTARRWGLFYL